ncbi:hypothetical protein GJ699_26825 [Duganella sp. FT80W]|uniref:Lipoprotein n=1 Tax=Duganella guangzhouensis TaxID=2666084 RepID=A0A6I2L7I8_9BURK|nr:hypothetical protein [Duganella guangzhouensis]MRW93612.1 hypothetical protein [Duganella guangzhouensis]
MNNIKLMLAALLLLSGCASKTFVNRADWEQGARHGWVVGEYAAGQPVDTLPACMARLPANELASHHFVRVRYSQARLQHEVVVELPAGAALRDGEQVEVWPADCAAGKLAHIDGTPPQAMRP